MTSWAIANGYKPDMRGLCEDPALHRAVQAAVDRVNAELSVIEKVRRVSLACDAFTIDNEMLTPSLKIRRHKIREVYGAKLDALYKG